MQFVSQYGKVVSVSILAVLIATIVNQTAFAAVPKLELSIKKNARIPVQDFSLSSVYKCTVYSSGSEVQVRRVYKAKKNNKNIKLVLESSQVQVASKRQALRLLKQKYRNIKNSGVTSSAFDNALEQGQALITSFQQKKLNCETNWSVLNQDDQSPTPSPTITATPSPTVSPTDIQETPTPVQVAGAAPSNLQITNVASDSISFSWLINASDLQWSRIERATNPNGSWIELAEALPPISDHVDSDLCSAQTFYYRIKNKIIGVNGYTAPSNVVTATTIAGTSCPIGGGSSPSSPPPATPAPTATPPFTAAAANVSNTSEVKITNPYTTTLTSYPLQFGRVFIQGEIANYPKVLINGVVQSTQADVKTRWPDNSVQHAIISIVIPSIGPNQTLVLSFINQATGNNTGALTQPQMLAPGYDFDLITSLTSAAPTPTATPSITPSPTPTTTPFVPQVISTSARDLLANGKFAYWAQGPIATTVIIADHSLNRIADLGFDSYKSIRPTYIATFWPSINKVKIRSIYEISNTEYYQNQRYSAEIFLGDSNPQLVETQAAFTHIAGARWTRVFWTNGEPQDLHINHGLKYLGATTLFPKFDTDLVVPESARASSYLEWQNVAKGAGSAGNLMKAMGSGGARPDIGYFPTWTVQWLYTGDFRMAKKSFGNNDLSAFFPYHIREGEAGRFFDRADTVSSLGKVLSISSRPSVLTLNLNYSTTTASDKIVPVGSIYNEGWAPENAHQPGFSYAEYLLSGDPFYLEELQFFSSWAAAYQTPSTTQFYGRGPSYEYGGIGSGDGSHARMIAWQIRNRVHAHKASPDGSIEKVYFGTLINDAIEIWKGERNFPSTGNAAWNWGHTIGNAGCLLWISTPLAGPVYIQNFTCQLPSLGIFYNGGDGGGGGGLFAASNVSEGIGSGAATVISPWMQYYLTVVFRQMQRMGYSVNEFVELTANYLIGHLTEPGVNPYLLTQYRSPALFANYDQNNNVVYSIPTSFAQLQSAYSLAAQNSTAFNSVSPNANPNTAESYVWLANAAMSALAGHSNQALAQLAYQNWLNLTASYYQAVNDDNPKWAIIP